MLVEDRPKLPLRFHDESFFQKLMAGLPQPVKDRLKTFFDLATTDPDDLGLLASCTVHNPYSLRDRFLAYDLIDHYVVYWRVQRKKAEWGELFSLRLRPPVRVDILEIKQV